MARKKEADFFELLKEEMKYASNLSKSLKELLSNFKNDGYNGDLKECLENITLNQLNQRNRQYFVMFFVSYHLQTYHY